ncbi:hypothetical protein E24_00022 [Faustovirus]|nr:hypothetical protein E24_00022 [Faustovirus]AMN83944.1 hypothetical protein D5a_00022 [Faustovirus]AMN84928.1 hypothetical protein E23_00022 [Faustovirus]
MSRVTRGFVSVASKTRGDREFARRSEAKPMQIYVKGKN